MTTATWPARAARAPMLVVLALVAGLTVAGIAVVGRAAPDAGVAGPHRGRFIVECTYSHSAPDDPIVFPGQPGQSHLHDFFGNVSTDASSTPESLGVTDTTCFVAQDRAAYWAPALFLGDEQIVPTSSDAYYRAAPGVDPAAVAPFPFGFRAIAGDAGAPATQSTDVVGWACGRNRVVMAAPLDCSPQKPLTLHVFFPDCWDGVQLDNWDHKGHVARSEDGVCPDTHPVHVPQLEFVVQYPYWDDPADLRLASGPTRTAHADFFNAWEPAKLANEVEHCIGRDVVCGVPSL